MNQEERITTVANEVRDTLIRKNLDYGDSFAKRFTKHGILSAFIRMEDKWGRFENLVSGAKANVEESVEDTLIDLAGYAILTAVELRKQKEPAKESDKLAIIDHLKYQLANYSQLAVMYPKSKLIEDELARIKSEVAKLDDF